MVESSVPRVYNLRYNQQEIHPAINTAVDYNPSFPTLTDRASLHSIRRRRYARLASSDPSPYHQALHLHPRKESHPKGAVKELLPVHPNPIHRQERFRRAQRTRTRIVHPAQPCCSLWKTGSDRFPVAKSPELDHYYREAGFRKRHRICQEIELVCYPHACWHNACSAHVPRSYCFPGCSGECSIRTVCISIIARFVSLLSCCNGKCKVNTQRSPSENIL